MQTHDMPHAYLSSGVLEEDIDPNILSREND